MKLRRKKGERKKKTKKKNANVAKYPTIKQNLLHFKI